MGSFCSCSEFAPRGRKLQALKEPLEQPSPKRIKLIASTGQQVAPYGLWESAVTKDAIFSKTWSMISPRACRRTGRAYFCENRPDGRTHIVQLKDGEFRDVLPEGYSARSRVYEYGGGAFGILPGSRIIFSNLKDCSVNILDVDTGDVKCLIQSKTLRYGDYSPHPGDEPWVLAVEEDHEDNTAEKVKNCVVAINTETAEVKRIVEGADFYMFPSFSFDGTKVAWEEWNFPGLPWSGVRLYWADWTPDGITPGSIEHIAGTDSVTITEPRWGPDGYLYFCQEVTNYYQLYRQKPGEKEPTLLALPGLDAVEFGKCVMACASHFYTILSSKHLVACYTDNGADRTVLVNLDTLETTDVPLGLSYVTWDGIERLSDTSFLIIGRGSTKPEVLCKVEIGKDGISHSTIRNSTEQALPPSTFSKPEHIQFPAKKGPKREIHGFFWPPHNPNYTGPAGQKPPLIIQSHGGPTGHTPPGLQLPLQYWTSRGYATFGINYTGSSGHGKAYRELLTSRWGAIDVDDVAECVEYLIETGRVDGSRVGIRGGSAGGYNVLQALCHYPEIFAGGVSLYGISEVKLLLATTHKMESQYGGTLMFQPGMTEEEKQKLMEERSPVNYAGNITAPLLLIHGEEDKVVPISQAYTMYDDITERGGNVKLVKFPGEGHGFRKGENKTKAYEEEENWWKKTLVRS
ncbi:Alpha/Beta hydrolase protein [Xylariales sp. PMI_506]|nr:Alpha/Beta hydrolase protein [Xylariales sp. PMI_506]